MTTTQTEQFTVRRSTGGSPDIAGALPLPLPPAGHFINGSFVPGSSGQSIDVVDPATEQVIASVQAGTADDVDVAVAAAVVAQKTWGATTPKERADVLNLIATIIEQNRQAFEAIESANTGKPRAVSEDDVSSTIDTFRFMAGASRTLTSMAGGDYATDHTSVILREPVGVVGVITPWNYPLLMAAWKIAPILAAGNSIVIKPSEQTPLSTLKLVEVLAGRIPDGILNVVTGRGRTVGQRLSEHPDIALVALTGSVVSGQAVAETAAKSVKRVHLELGGKAPVVVFPDADLRAAAAGVRNAGFWNAGQDCGAACRVLVHESVAEEFTEHLVREVSTLVIGAPDAGDDVEIGPMISLPHYERVKESLAEARAAGHDVAIGGSTMEGPGYFIEPTVISNVPAGAHIATHEIFGPVVTVETFSSTEEAVTRANESPYGLSASVWTRDSSLSLRIPKQLDFGTVWVNAHLVLACEVPWGGFKGSGYGRDLSLYALDDYSRTKHVMINHGA
ncbi:aminobutyraldehyde dehydrogenase [Arthrobacter sp. Rue61a]|jgi:aldehyde dehydrogenase (NAD+)/aminobutyraldehyde dehydrogenase|uniref:aminobutyraldehyde dehydrogenase n=1 Tax=Micrococcaceae TaxID=1268 RepID=UPI00027DF611|nr:MULTISPECIES: aminobutyraldehyde dehydrogenase [Micrococcaceae]AFR31023.1 putative gamma-aminobutyraldehyde dehydrogenase [Arthrobacter sp. Rue61a]